MLVQFATRNMGSLWVNAEEISTIRTGDDCLVLETKQKMHHTLNLSSYNLDRIKEVDIYMGGRK
jgi:hypothetical protein